MADQPTPTTPVANPTPGAEDQNTPATPVGAGTDPVTPSQDTPTTTKSDPAVAAAMKALQEAGVEVFTKKQHDGHMAAARRQWQLDADTKAQQAAADAQSKALQEQGQFKPLYEQAQTTIQQHEAAIQERDTLIASLSERVNAQISEQIKNAPAIVKELDPGPDNLTARLEWFAKVQKHPEALQQGRPAYPGVSGYTPQPVGTQNGSMEITPPASRRSF
jgi:ribosomal protein S16